MSSSFRLGLAILATSLLIAAGTFAFGVPLSDEAVREAYFLGQRRDDTTAKFLETYSRYPAVPQSGPHVFEIELFTPYALAVETSSKHAAGYSAQQARLDYQARGDSLRVGVYVRYTSTYGPGFPYSAVHTTGWKDFQVRLKLNGKTLESRSVKYEATRMGTGGGKGGGSRQTGFLIWQEYDPSNLNSSDATVEIETPDGQVVVSSFDLSRLR